MTGRSTFTRRLTLIVAAGLVIRLAYLLFVEHGSALGGDALYYHYAANAWADGGGFVEPFRWYFGSAQELAFLDDVTKATLADSGALQPGHREPTAGHPPLWVLVLAVASFLGFDSVGAHQVVSVLVGTATVAAVGLLGREAAGERVGLLAAAGAATYAFIWLNDALIMSESLVMLLAALTSLAALRFARSPSWGNGWPLSILGALGALTRAELALFLPIAAAVALWRHRAPFAERARTYVLIGLLAAAVVAPWVGRNLVRFEEPVLLSNGSGIVLAQANCDETYFGQKQGSWEFGCGLPPPVVDGDGLLDESERDVVYRDRGLDYIRDNPGRLITHAVPKRILRQWSLYDPVEQLRADILVEGRVFRLSVVGLVQFYALAPLAVAGAVIARRRHPGVVAMVGLWPILATVTAALAFATTRYRAASEVAIVVFAAIAVDALLTRRGSDPPVGDARRLPADVGR